jgi:hypothetical protein
MQLSVVTDGFEGERLCLAANNRVGEGRHTMRVHSYTIDESSLENKAPNPNNSATRGYSLTAFSVPLLPRPQDEDLARDAMELSLDPRLFISQLATGAHADHRPLLGCVRFAFRFGRASIFPLAHQPVNDSECDYRETQSDNSQRGCRLHIEDNEFSRERQNADEYHRLDLYDAVKALYCLEDAVIEFHGN